MKRSLCVLVWLLAFVPAVAGAQIQYAIHPHTFKAGEQSTALLSFRLPGGLAQGQQLVVEMLKGPSHLPFPITSFGPILREGVVSQLFVAELSPIGSLWFTAASAIPPDLARYSTDETGEYEVIGRPFCVYGAHELVAVRRG